MFRSPMLADSPPQEPGVLVVDKPGGPTSHDIVAQARRLFGTRRVGHAGTLDPAASGVLLIMVGEASKLSAFLAGEQKSYRATVAFGRATNTLDAAGEPVEEVSLARGWLDQRRLEEALAAESRRRSQEPPQFSAIKSGGRVAHKLARKGESLELEERDVSVHSLRLLECTDIELTVELAVSKGYYVRAFARDLGRALGVPAHLATLRRLSSGGFTLSEAVCWPPSARPPLIPLLDAARRCLPTAVLTPDGAARARMGKALGLEHFAKRPEHESEGGPFAWEFEERLVAVGHQRADEFRVARGFNEPK